MCFKKFNIGKAVSRAVNPVSLISGVVKPVGSAVSQVIRSAGEAPPINGTIPLTTVRPAAMESVSFQPIVIPSEAEAPSVSSVGISTSSVALIIGGAIVVVVLLKKL